MTQAILYGSYPDVRPGTCRMEQYKLTLPQNPLHFSFPPEIDEESLMSGATLLSNAILESGEGPPLLTPRTIRAHIL
jgi:nuclear pore complex protein Nup133